MSVLLVSHDIHQSQKSKGNSKSCITGYKNSKSCTSRLFRITANLDPITHHTDNLFIRSTVPYGKPPCNTYTVLRDISVKFIASLKLIHSCARKGLMWSITKLNNNPSTACPPPPIMTRLTIHCLLLSLYIILITMAMSGIIFCYKNVEF